MLRVRYTTKLRIGSPLDFSDEGQATSRPPMTLGNMRSLGVERLLVSCLNQACRHEVVFDVSSYPDDMDVQSLAPRMICSKCGGEKAFGRPNWKLQAPRT